MAAGTGTRGNVIAAQSLRSHCFNIISIRPHFSLYAPASIVFTDVVFRAIMRGISVHYVERVVLASLQDHIIRTCLLAYFPAKLVYTWHSNMTATYHHSGLIVPHIWSYVSGYKVAIWHVISFLRSPSSAHPGDIDLLEIQIWSYSESYPRWLLAPKIRSSQACQFNHGNLKAHSLVPGSRQCNPRTFLAFQCRVPSIPLSSP